MECPRSAGEVLGVDDGQAAIAISDQNLIGGAVHADIVGVLAKIDLPGRGIIRSRENAHRSVARVCDVKRIRRRHISEALWLSQSGNRLNEFTFLEVDDPDGVVAEFGNEEPLPRQIDRHVIDWPRTSPRELLASSCSGWAIGRPTPTNSVAAAIAVETARPRNVIINKYLFLFHAAPAGSARAFTPEPQFARGIRSYPQPATGSPVTRS